MKRYDSSGRVPSGVMLTHTFISSSLSLSSEGIDIPAAVKVAIIVKQPVFFSSGLNKPRPASIIH